MFDEFVRISLEERDVITLTSPFRLIEPHSFLDAFDTSTFDHLRGLFDIRIHPEANVKGFPERWRFIGSESKIEYIIKDSKTISSKSGKRQKSQQQTGVVRGLLSFLVEVSKEHSEKGTPEQWFNALKKHQITDYSDLQRLDDKDWEDRLTFLPLGIRKMIHNHVELARHGESSEQQTSAMEKGW